MIIKNVVQIPKQHDDYNHYLVHSDVADFVIFKLFLTNFSNAQLECFFLRNIQFTQTLSGLTANQNPHHKYIAYIYEQSI